LRVLTEGEAVLTTDNRDDRPSPAWAQFDPLPVIGEASLGQINGTIILTPPAGWEFNPNSTVVPTVIGSTHLDPAIMSVDSIVIPVTQPSAAPGGPSRIIFSGIQLRPMDCAGAALGEHFVRITTVLWKMKCLAGSR